MPIQFPDFQRISFDEANPWLQGMERGQKLTQNFMQFPQDLQAKILANQIAKVQAQYAEPMAKEGLTKAQQENIWNPKVWQSEIGLRGAQAGKLGKETQWYDKEAASRIGAQAAQAAHAQEEANKIKYMLQHPGFMGGDTTKSIEALRQMGLVNSNYQPSQQPQMNQQQPQQQPNSSGGFTPITGNTQAEQYAQAQQIANAVTKQQQNMNLPQDQISHQPNMMPDLTGNSATPGFNINGLVQALINKPMSDLQYKQTLTNVMQQNLAGKAFTSMPSVEKEYAISQARAFGYTGEQASRLFNQGYDLASMAKSKGYDADNPSSWPMARGAPTAAIQTRIQRANSTLAALDSVEPAITAAYQPYAQRFNNVSPSLIKDMLTGENPDQQAEAFAAYALYPEISALRINAMGGNVGEGAIQHIADAAYSRLHTLGLSPNAYVYGKAQKRVGELIRQMNKAENSAIYSQTNRSYEEDDRSQLFNKDLSHMSDAELHKIAGG
jgi:hypothetical protein